MDAGVGLKIAGLIAGLGIAGYLFGIAAEQIGKAWGELLDETLPPSPRDTQFRFVSCEFDGDCRQVEIEHSGIAIPEPCSDYHPHGDEFPHPPLDYPR